MCFIKKGLLRAFYVKGENEVSSWFMKEGDICVSIESFYGQRPGYEYIQAIEDTQLYYLYYAELELIYQKFPEFNVIGRILTIKYLTLWSEQLYAIRMQNAKERYEWLLQFHPELIQRVPQKFIASYLDITPETLSKIRSEREFFKQKTTI
jgi:CRP-like cAMP-binding protein